MPAARVSGPRAWRRDARDVVIGVTVIVLIGVFVAQPFRVEGGSMRPLLETGQRLLVSKLSYRLHAIERDDVVIVRDPSGLALVKRVVGLPGERVSWDDGSVLEGPGAAGGTLLGPDEYYVLGDARDVSIDSRTFGPVPREAIRGKAVFRYWPPSRAGALH